MNVTHTKFEDGIVGISVAGSSIIVPGEDLQAFTGSMSGGDCFSLSQMKLH